MALKRSSNSQLKGDEAESLALNYLQNRGLSLIAKNYYCKYGEIDIIMHEQERIVFVEVRSRKNDLFGSALESVTPQKQQKLTLTAKHYIQAKRVSESVPMRFDVIGISGKKIQWIKNAF